MKISLTDEGRCVALKAVHVDDTGWGSLSERLSEGKSRITFSTVTYLIQQRMHALSDMFIFCEMVQLLQYQAGIVFTSS